MAFLPTQDGDYEIEDVENYSGQKNLVFSHQDLVMKAMRRVIELCGHELAEGMNETSFNPIKKTTTIVYKEDTKKAFLNAVKVCKLVMACDFDKEAEDGVEEILDLIEEERQRLLDAQNTWYNSLNLKRRTEMKLDISPKFLHKELKFYQEFMEYEIEGYFELFEELNKLSKRLHFYEAEDFEG